MKTGKLFALMIALAIACGAAFAATSEPILQVTSSSTVPSTVYPGTIGYLQATLTNNGAATAKYVSARYNIDGVDSSLPAGDVGVGSSIQLSVPFKIGPNAAGSIQVVSAVIYYNYDSSSGAIANKQTSISIPVIVQQQNPLEIRTLSISKKAIAPGERASFALELKNNGGVINNLVISMPSNSSFSLDGSTQQAVGSIASGSSANVSLSLASSTSTPTGTYSIPVAFTYQDALRQPTEDTLQVGPISVLDASSQYRLGLEPLTPSEIGSRAVFLLTLKNGGSEDVSATVDINATDAFTPIGPQRLYFDSIGAGSSVSRNITLGISSSKSAGYYSLPLKLATSSGQSAIFYAGIAVEATPELTVSLDSGSSTTVQIANTGNTQVRGVYAKARQKGAAAYTESFIGTLNMDDSATLALGSQSTAAGILPSKELEVVITFRDSINLQHMINETLDASGISSYSSNGATTASGGASPNGSGSQFTGRNQNPLGMLLGGRSSGTTGSGFGILPIIVGGIVAVAVGYFAYRRFRKGKKPQAASPPASEKGGKQR